MRVDCKEKVLVLRPESEVEEVYLKHIFGHGGSESVVVNVGSRSDPGRLALDHVSIHNRESYYARTTVERPRLTGGAIMFACMTCGKHNCKCED